MASPANPAPEKPARNHSLAVAGAISLFLMAFLWAADSSFRYIFFGIAFFCFAIFLSKSGLLNQSTAMRDFRDDLRTIARRNPTPGAYRNPQMRSAKSDPKVVVFASFFIGIVFFVIITAVLVFSDDPAAGSLDQARMFFDQGTYDSALIYYRRASADDPSGADALRGMGNCFLALQQYDSSIFYYNRSLQLDPYDEQTWYNNALAAYYQVDYQLTRSTLRNLLDYNPGHTYAMMLYGDTFYQVNQYDSAIVWYEKAYQTGIEDPNLNHVMAYIYDTKGRPSDAIRYYQETVELDSSRTDIYRRLGELMPGEEGDVYRDLWTKLGSRQ